jgi:hypothetical protein
MEEGAEDRSASLDGVGDAEQYESAFEESEETLGDVDLVTDIDTHDVALSEESSGIEVAGHEVTSAPSDDDQNQALEIVTSAVEQGSAGSDDLASSGVSEETGSPKRSRRLASSSEPESDDVSEHEA